MTTKKITVIGSSNTDMVIKSSHLPLPGETVLGGHFSMNPGGKGANQAVAAAALGGDVTFIGRVGDDVFGHQSIKGFEKLGIDTSLVQIDTNEASGTALIMVDEQAENCISVALGANAAMANSDIDAGLPAIQKSAYLLIQLEIPLEVVAYAVDIANKNKVPVILNPAPAQSLSDELISQLSIITPNQTEAEILTGIKVTDQSSAMQSADVFREKGVDVVIITMGSKGAYVLSDELNKIIPSPKVKPVDTTAAGDTFNGALTVALSEGQELEAAITFANEAAAVSVTRMGAQSSVPTRSDLQTIN